MNGLTRLAVAVILIAICLSNAQPCGPGYITPLFDTTSAPESPYSDFAAGNLGIVKPTFRRSVLYVAYRHIAGNGLNTPEQRAMIEVWKAEIDNKDFRDDSVDIAVKAWADKRKEIVGKESATPSIYAERSYGGYDFFPNCTKNAFETATETLADRVSSHGPSDTGVQSWVKAQDQVFLNCASGKQDPEALPPGSPDWLQKDRSYQLAAASFYSLDYNDSKRRFAEIALDSESPWRETADYLVARTLIRQASLSKPIEKATPFYEEAEAHLQRFVSASGKFSGSAERLLGLVKYRLHPKERASELAKNLTFYGGNENFRQDVVDYNWLLDKFENEVLSAEEKRKNIDKGSNTDSNTAPQIPGNSAFNGAVPNSESNAANTSVIAENRNQTVPERKNEDDIEINIYTSNYAKNWRIFVRADATDDEAISQAEKVVDQPLTDEMKQQIGANRQSGYSQRFLSNVQPTYEGGYWGEEKLTPSLVPDFLRKDELTDWLYAFQMKGAESYLYSLQKYRETNSDLWLMTALSQADKSSTQLTRLIEAAGKSNRSSAAYPTIAYHTARILLAQSQSTSARKLIDEMLNLGDTLPLSARNSFTDLRLGLTESLDDFLRYSLKKPFAFDFDGDVGSVETIIAEQKSWFNPETYKEGREAYEAEVEARYKNEKLWENRTMFDSATINVLNQHFPTASLMDVLNSEALPDYMRERFALAIWTRAFLLADNTTLQKITPELLKYRSDFESYISRIGTAKTAAARDNARLFFILKNPLLSPYIEDGMGKTNNEQEQWSSDDWWCEPYDSENSDGSDTGAPSQLPPRPAFLTVAQSQTAQAERRKLKEIGDAPKFLAGKVMTWAKRYPTDRRVPEMLYIMIEANGWTKYGCGSNEELRDELESYLKRHYPTSEWTTKLSVNEPEK